MATFAIDTSLGLAISAGNLLENYFFGINTRFDDAQLSIKQIEYHIKHAQTELENYLSLKLLPRKVFETQPYNVGEFKNWGYIKTRHPVREVISLSGIIAGSQVIRYPKEWLTKQEASDERVGSRLNIIPFRIGAATINVPLTGLYPNYGHFGTSNIPEYWNVDYITGFKEIHADILNTLGQLAAIGIFNQLGDIIIGAGIAGHSFSIDNLNQSISTTSSAENAGYSARIKQYLVELKVSLARLKSNYLGITFMAM